MLLAIVLAAASSQGAGAAQAVAADKTSCGIRGRVTSGGVPLPGVALTIGEGPDAVATSTGLDGSYRISLPAAGEYHLRASLAGFAAVTRDVTLAPEPPCGVSVDVEMVLQSRVPKPVEAPSRSAPAPGSPAADTGQRQAQGSGQRQRGGGAAQGGARGPGRPGAGEQRRGGRFQGLDLMADSAAEGGEPADAAASAPLPPGFNADAPTEALALAGNGRQVQTVDSLLYRDRLQWLDEAGGDMDALARRVAQAGLEGGPPGGGRFGGGGPGGFGGPGGGFGGGGFRGGEGFGGFQRSNKLQGSVYYNLSGAPFDARPYSLNGQPADKADYFDNRYGATLGGPVKIPGLYDGSSRTSFQVNYSGTHSRAPYSAYSTVPTPEEREGDLSLLDTTVYDPLTGEPFSGNVIPRDRIDPSALDLLQFLPLPNQTGLVQNFHYVTATSSDSNQITLRLTHALTASSASPPARGQGGGAGPGGGGFRGGQRRPSLSVALTYRESDAVDTPTFPTLGGSTHTSSWDVPVTLSLPTGKVFHQLRLDYNRNRSDGNNIFAGVRDVAGEAGIQGASTDPFDWGVPNLSFSTLTSLRDRNPSFRLDQRFSVGDVATLTKGKHNFRFGGLFRAQSLDSETDANARGSFVFTGLYTTAVAGGAAVPGTGSDFADFLLGQSQQASVQYGPGKVSFRGRAFSLFLMDDWRVNGKLTLNVGVRYEYVAPLEEGQDHLVNLDVTPDFTAATPVLSGQAGPYTGAFPASLVNGDWNNLAPRIGMAWKPKSNTTVRAGFGVNYNLGAYSGIAQHLAGQPPFAVSNTQLGTATESLPLATGLTLPGPPTTNSFGIDKNYALAAALLWNLDVQRQFGSDWVIGIGYTGTQGLDLDQQRAPNRGPEGLRIPGVAPFLWESSGASSILHSGTLRVRKRTSHGIGGGFSYTYGKSIDDASSIGGGAVVVAQNDQDLKAERGLSSFDRRHLLAADWQLELPIGPGRKWLREGALASIIGGWVWSGTATWQSGTPFTARVVGDFGDVSRGVNGTLRANVTGQPVVIASPTTAQWFNTGAFSVPPGDSFGDVGRNTVEGPSSFLVNMTLIKNISLGRPRTLSLRVQANNVFNTPPFVGIDTVVNSPTYGQVVQVGSMRQVQLQMRFRF